MAQVLINVGTTPNDGTGDGRIFASEIQPYIWYKIQNIL